MKDSILLGYYRLLWTFWDYISLRTRDDTLYKGRNAMALAYKQKYRFIKYKPRGRV